MRSDIKDFPTLVELLRTSVKVYAERYQQHMMEIERMFPTSHDSTSYDNGRKFKDEIVAEADQTFNNGFKNTSECFKVGITEFFDTEFFNTEYTSIAEDTSTYIIFRQAVLSHESIKYQYYVLGMPFGYKDQDKYELKVKSWIKKYKKNQHNNTVALQLSPYETLKFFSLNVKNIINKSNSYINNAPRTKRQKAKYISELTLKLIKIILCDCPIYQKQVRGSIRITDNNIEMYHRMMEKYLSDIKDQDKKKFHISP